MSMLELSKQTEVEAGKRIERQAEALERRRRFSELFTDRSEQCPDARRFGRGNFEETFEAPLFGNKGQRAFERCLR